MNIFLFPIDVSPETETAPPITTPTSPKIEKVATTPSGRSRTDREERRSANTLYQEISFQDADALGEMDEGADITGELLYLNSCLNKFD